LRNTGLEASNAINVLFYADWFERKRKENFFPSFWKKELECQLIPWNPFLTVFSNFSPFLFEKNETIIAGKVFSPFV